MKNYIKLLQFLRGHFGIFSLAVVFMMFSTLFEGVQLSMMVPVIDRVFTNKDIVLPGVAPGFIMQLVEKLNSIPQKPLLSILVVSFMGLLIVKHFFTFFHGLFMNDVS